MQAIFFDYGEPFLDQLAHLSHVKSEESGSSGRKRLMTSEGGGVDYLLFRGAFHSPPTWPTFVGHYANGWKSCFRVRTIRRGLDRRRSTFSAKYLWKSNQHFSMYALRDTRTYGAFSSSQYMFL